MSELQTNTLLQGGKYRIEKSLGQGGFGITYLAEQTNLGRKVCIKEFFMKEYGERTESSDADSDATVLTGVNAVTSAAAEIMGRYREKFVKEARTIARLDHPGIVRIHDVFEENGTAYYVMDFIEGENLNDLVKREGPLSEERALGYIRQVADALSFVHGHNIMHLDVKPANILVRKSDDKAILIDFGTAKQYDSEGTQTSTTPIGISAGYAPIEMTKPGGVQTFSPETDVYSLGATLYYLVTGQNPPDASERMEMIEEGETLRFPEPVSSAVSDTVEKSMRTRKKRIQTVGLFLESLPAFSNAVPEDPHALYCSKCGRELALDTRFCPNCGTAVALQDASREHTVNHVEKPKEEKKMDIGLENVHEGADTGFDVMLTNPGRAYLQTIKFVHELTGLALKETKELVDKAPAAIILQGVSKTEAERVKTELEKIGAIGEIIQNWATEKVNQDVGQKVSGFENGHTIINNEEKASFSSKADRAIHTERDRLVQKFMKKEQEIATFENNMGFFSQSKNAEALLAELSKKIDIARQELAELEEKIKEIDSEYDTQFEDAITSVEPILSGQPDKKDTGTSLPNEFRDSTPKELSLFDVLNRPMGVLPVKRWGANMARIKQDLVKYGWEVRVHKPWILLGDNHTLEINGYDMTFMGVRPTVEAVFPGKRRDSESTLKLKRTCFVFPSTCDLLSFFNKNGMFLWGDSSSYKNVDCYHQEFKTVGGKRVTLSLYLFPFLSNVLCIDYGTVYGTDGIPFPLELK